MIGSLRGTVLERIVPSTVLVEVGGVGYLVNVTPRVFAELEPTTSCFLHVHQHIREDSQTLFGFTTRDDRQCFDILLGAHGIGPSMAMAILGTHSPRGLHNIVITSDVGALTMVPGVGKKTAERLLVELKNRLDLPATSSDGPRSGSSSTSDVREALIGLGYSDGEIREALRGIDADSDSATMLREALRLLAVRRA